MKTITPSQVKGNDRKWYIVDAKDKTLGRLSTEIAVILK
jgi:large subunit ribosomal protein L13